MVGRRFHISHIDDLTLDGLDIVGQSFILNI